jgi:hypothetical protein
MITPDNEYCPDNNPEIFDSKEWKKEHNKDIEYRLHIQTIIVDSVKLHHGLKSNTAKLTQWDSIAALGKILADAEDGEK